MCVCLLVAHNRAIYATRIDLPKGGSIILCVSGAYEGIFLKKIRTHLDLLTRLGRKNVKTLRWDQRLQIQNLFMAFKRFPDGNNIGSTV